MSDDPASWATWPFVPNWRTAYTVSYEFKTDIFTADDGSEQRRALRATPRKTIAFNALAHADGLRRFNAFMDRRQSETILMPEATRSVRLAAAVAGGSEFTIDGFPPAWLVVGARITVADGQRGNAGHTVTRVSGRRVTVEPTLLPSRAGAKVHPALPGLLEPSLSAKRATSRTAECEVSFKVHPGLEDYDFGAVGPLYDGVEWLQIRPNWVQGLPVTHQWPRTVIDFGRGRTSFFTPIKWGTSLRSLDLLAADPSAIVNFFGRMQGQCAHFLLSSMEEDMVPVGGVGGGTLVVRGTEIAETYADDPVRSLIEVVTATGQRFARRITRMDTEGANSLLQLDAPLPSMPDGVQRVLWLTCSRFATDTLDVVYSTDRVARILLNIQTLPLSAGGLSSLRVTTDAALRMTTAGDQREVIAR